MGSTQNYRRGQEGGLNQVHRQEKNPVNPSKNNGWDRQVAMALNELTQLGVRAGWEGQHSWQLLQLKVGYRYGRVGKKCGKGGVGKVCVCMCVRSTTMCGEQRQARSCVGVGQGPGHKGHGKVGVGVWWAGE